MKKDNKALRELRNETNPYKHVKRVLQLERKKRKSPPAVHQIFDQIEQANIAMKKLFLDEVLTDDELDALLNSEFMKPSEEYLSSDRVHQASELYKQSKFALAVSSPILFSSIELEVLDYFGRHPELLHSLPPRKFEELIATIFRNNGFNVELTPETRDGGVDIFAVQKDGFGGSILNIVECKRYSPEYKVGIGIVQRMLGVVEQHRATQGVIVTTSSFTRDAQTCAQSSQYRLGLKGYADLSKWLIAFSK